MADPEFWQQRAGKLLYELAYECPFWYANDDKRAMVEMPCESFDRIRDSAAEWEEMQGE